MFPVYGPQWVNLCQRFPDLRSLQEFADSSGKIMFTYPVPTLFIFFVLFWKQETWSQTIERSLAECTSQYLFTPTKPGQQCVYIQMKKFGEPYYIMERGTIDQKIQLLLGSMEKTGNDTFNSKQLEQVSL